MSRLPISARLRPAPSCCSSAISTPHSRSSSASTRSEYHVCAASAAWPYWRNAVSHSRALASLNLPTVTRSTASRGGHSIASSSCHRRPSRLAQRAMPRSETYNPPLGDQRHPYQTTMFVRLQMQIDKRPQKCTSRTLRRVFERSLSMSCDRSGSTGHSRNLHCCSCSRCCHPSGGQPHNLNPGAIQPTGTSLTRL